MMDDVLKRERTSCATRFSLSLFPLTQLLSTYWMHFSNYYYGSLQIKRFLQWCKINLFSSMMGTWIPLFTDGPSYIPNSSFTIQNSNKFFLEICSCYRIAISFFESSSVFRFYLFNDLFNFLLGNMNQQQSLEQFWFSWYWYVQICPSK